MSNRHDNYFKQILKEEDLDAEFAELEQAAWNIVADLGLYGLITGGAVSPSLSAHVANISAFNAYGKSGQRLVLASDGEVDFGTDSDGNPTVPTSGNFRWVSLVARYGKFGDDPVVDGDSATVYFTQTEGLSSTGDVTVDSGAANFGKIRVIQGTQSGSPSTANRPAVTSPDILIADLLIDDTGNLHGSGAAGISTARTDRIVLRLSGGELVTGSFEAAQYVLLEDHVFDDSGVHVRKYVTRSAATFNYPAIVQTVNARWDGTTQLWNADAVGQAASMFEIQINSFLWNTQTTGAATWTDTRHDPAGWDSEMIFAGVTTNGKTQFNSNGIITGNGPQTAYVGLMATAVHGGQEQATSWTWPQEMAAAPSSVTLEDISGGIYDSNVASVGFEQANQYGGIFAVTPAGGDGVVFRAARKVIAVP
jgi:hypothetical protein